MTFQTFRTRRRPKPFADRLVDIAVALFVVLLFARAAWSLV
jgi:hypothetical protein